MGSAQVRHWLEEAPSQVRHSAWHASDVREQGLTHADYPGRVGGGGARAHAGARGGVQILASRTGGAVGGFGARAGEARPVTDVALRLARQVEARLAFVHARPASGG